MLGTGLDLAIFSLPEADRCFSRIDCDFLNLVLTARPADLPPGHQDHHRQYEFLIPLSSLPGFFVTDREFDCLPGSLIPINPGLCHGVRCGRQSVSFILVLVEQEHLDGLAGRILGQDAFQGFPIDLFPVQAEIQSLIDRLVHENSGTETGREVLMHNLAENLAILLIRHYSQPPDKPGLIDANHLTEEQSRFQKVLAFMRSHYYLRMSVDSLASKAGMNSFHFIRTFKKQFAISPYNYLIHIRITAARRLLTETRLSVAQIGKQCGFPSASRFSAVFQKDTGLTPSQYRKIRKSG